MDLSVRKSDLLGELQFFQGVIERKNTIPILANVLVEAGSDGTLKLLATDLELGLRSQCKALVKKPGELTLPAKKLFEIVRELPETDIRIKQDGEKNQVTITADQFKSRIQTLPKTEFPDVPKPPNVNPVSLLREELHLMVSRTQFAITGEDTRYFLNGALFVLKTNSMDLVATDGHRLALATTSREKEEIEETRTIFPKKTLIELSKLLADSKNKDISYECGEAHLFFRVDGRELISRMIDAQFPAFERVIPKGNDKRIEFDRDRLTSAIKRVRLLSSERSQAVKMRLTDNQVEVRSESAEVGEATEELEVNYSGEEVEICFNAQYVLDFLAVVNVDSVVLELKDEMSQAVMHPAGEETAYTYVIMPMRV
tara:strand:- start:4245 stop:5357 length:1113 start_codon:yes stop_codon:yes gene_type:complete